MNLDFQQTILQEFTQLEKQNFRLHTKLRHIFTCGGRVDPTIPIPPSFRARFYEHAIQYSVEIKNNIILAEEFSDFREHHYSDLLVFEEEIANLSALVLIFLESPGSLVELGIFCAKPNFYKKILVVVPRKEVEGNNSFILSGPLENIRKKEQTSVEIYPWPDSDIKYYDDEHLNDLLENINLKLSNLNVTKKFDESNSAHHAFLVAQVVIMCYPITLPEIESSLQAMKINFKSLDVIKHLYLLKKFKIINECSYSSYKYYYPHKKDSFMIFGKPKNNFMFDELKFKIRIAESYVKRKDSQSRKRLKARNLIREIYSEGM